MEENDRAAFEGLEHVDQALDGLGFVKADLVLGAFVHHDAECHGVRGGATEVADEVGAGSDNVGTALHVDVHRVADAGRKREEFLVHGLLRVQEEHVAHVEADGVVKHLAHLNRDVTRGRHLLDFEFGGTAGNECGRNEDGESGQNLFHKGLL